jgi:hypothetical protein
MGAYIGRHIYEAECDCLSQLAGARCTQLSGLSLTCSLPLNIPTVPSGTYDITIEHMENSSAMLVSLVEVMT